MKFLLPILFALSVAADPLPADRRATWQGRVGVPGGIPTRTVWTNLTSIDATGVTDVTSNIQAALDACPVNQAVKIPNGTFLLSGPIDIPEMVTLTGNGRTNTTLKAGYVRMLRGAAYSDSQNITAGWSRGSTNITLSSATLFLVGEYMVLDQLNDTSCVNTNGEAGPFNNPQREYVRACAQIVKITARSGNNLTFWPPVIWFANTNYAPQATVAPSYRSGAGVENLKLWDSNSNLTQLVYMERASGCWARGIEIQGGVSFAAHLLYSYGCEVRDCYIHNTASTVPGSGSGYGVFLDVRTTSCLIENNWTDGYVNGTIIQGASGNAVAYNFDTNNVYYATNTMEFANVGNHAIHPFCNLWEGNIGNGYSADDIHGSGSHGTIHRDYYDGHSGFYNPTRQLNAVNFSSWQRTNSVIGCILGDSTWTGANQFQATSSSDYDPNIRILYVIGHATSGAVPDDPVTVSSLIRQGNFDFIHNAVQWGPGNTNLVQSYLYGSKPAWWDTWGTTPWPPIGPDLTPMVNTLPVQLMVQTGGSPPPPPPPPPPTNLLRGATIRSAIFR